MSKETNQPIERTVIIIGPAIDNAGKFMATSIRVQASTKSEIVQTAIAWSYDNFKEAKSFEVVSSPAMIKDLYVPVMNSTVVGKKTYTKFSYKIQK